MAREIWLNLKNLYSFSGEKEPKRLLIGFSCMPYLIRPLTLIKVFGVTFFQKGNETKSEYLSTVLKLHQMNYCSSIQLAMS